MANGNGIRIGADARYHCGEEERRAALRRVIEDGQAVNGIDFLEVADQQAIGTPGEPWRQRILLVQCFAEAPAEIGLRQVRILGGVRITPVRAVWLRRLDDLREEPIIEVNGEDVDQGTLFPGTAGWLGDLRDAHPEPERVLVFGTDSNGDYSTYRLELVNHALKTPTPLAGFDPRLAGVDFSFKVECESDFDCKSEDECPPPSFDEPAIDYLAKDYQSFRRLMLDRLAATVPDWRERHPADLGVMLVEMLAYVGDHLSYFQDAAATEAYLGTARRRISVRRHARLVDYFIDEGAAARAWVVFEAGALADGQVLPGAEGTAAGAVPGTRLLSRLPGRPAVLDPAAFGSDALKKARRSGAAIFETAHDLTLFSELNELSFHTWSDRDCCLPQGATAATLRNPRDAAPEDLPLVVGDLLLFEEIVGPRTGAHADADPAHRHVVRVSDLEHGHDPVEDVAIVEIRWRDADALPFPLCLSATLDDGTELDEVAVARGNVVLADHGESLPGEKLGEVPLGDATFEPLLLEGPLTHAVPLPEGWVLPRQGAGALEPDEVEPAADLVNPPTVGKGGRPTAEPAIWLAGGARTWWPRRDLLSSGPFAEDFVAEIEGEGALAGRARLRFGDDAQGLRPAAGTEMTAHYRVSNGPAGNVGAGALAHAVTDVPGILGVRSPLAAWGGRRPESLEDVRQYAPQAFRVQQRAVTEDDYARVAERHPEVQKAAATFRWTGSWTTVFVTVDRRGGRPVDAVFEAQLLDFLNCYRMAGYDLEVDGPRFVPLDLALEVCVEPGYEKTAVARELYRVLGRRPLPDGRQGLFHPDAWTFAQPVYLSPIYAAVAAVDGVASAVVTRLQRWGALAADEIEEGILPIERLEIARLDNDPSRPENGHLEITLGGGR